MLLKPSLLTALPLPRHSCLHPSFPRRAWPREDGGGNQSPPSYPHMSFLVPRGISLPHAQRHPHCHPTIAKNPHPLLPSPHDQPLPLSSRMRAPIPLSHAPQMSFLVPRGISLPHAQRHPHCHPTIAKNPHPLLPSPHDQPLPLSSRMRGPIPLSHASQMSFRGNLASGHPSPPPTFIR